MASTTAIKTRIRSVNSTKQITKAMELVAASKMRRAQESAVRTKLYADTARELLTQLSTLTDVKRHPLFVERPVKTRVILLITSDRGLAGAYDSNMLRMYLAELKKDLAGEVNIKTIVVGRKGANVVTRLKGADVLGVYHDFADIPGANDLRPIVDQIIAMYKSGEIDAFDVIYTDFVNSLKQIPMQKRLLPAGFETTNVSHSLAISEFEPSVEEVLDTTVERLIEGQIFQALLDARASEYSMRMLAMRSATDNATNLVADLTLEFNNARQAAITQELAEITGGAEALND